jgi:hypothetical protein
MYPVIYLFNITPFSPNWSQTQIGDLLQCTKWHHVPPVENRISEDIYWGVKTVAYLNISRVGFSSNCSNKRACAQHNVTWIRNIITLQPILREAYSETADTSYSCLYENTKVFTAWYNCSSVALTARCGHLLRPSIREIAHSIPFNSIMSPTPFSERTNYELHKHDTQVQYNVTHRHKKHCTGWHTTDGWTIACLTTLYQLQRLFIKRQIAQDDSVRWTGTEFGERQQWQIWRYYPGIRLDGLRKTAESLILNSQCLSRDQNRTLREYKPEELPLETIFSGWDK